MAKLRVDKIAAPIVKDEFTGSVFFDGSSDYLSLPVSSDFQFGSGDFTIECWAYALDEGTDDILGIYNTGSNRRTFALRKDQTEAAQFLFSTDGSSGTSVTSAASVIQLRTWHHYAVVRRNSVYELYFDGVKVATKSDSTGAIYTNNDDGLRIGSSYNTDFHGYISNARICKGHAVYTGNFTVPTRELPVHKAPPKGVVFPAADNLTVLLACQSSTDATLDSSGRHILTANGNATAADANPGLFRRTNVSSTTTETTGSVYFDGTSDGLRSSPYDELILGTGAFTVECWFWRQNITDSWGSLVSDNLYSASGGWDLYTQYDDIRFYVGGVGEVFTVTEAYSAQTWTHVAVQRDSSGNMSCYINGVEKGVTATNSTDYTDNRILIGGNNSPAGSYPAYVFNGYISNVRVCKGHNVYTSNFAPPTRELEVHPGPEDDRTILLACYDGENVFAEKTGKIIAANGDRLSSPTPTATDSPIGITTFQPGLTRNVDPTAGPTFQGGAGYASQNWLTLPKGTTTDRNRTGGRGLFANNTSPNTSNVIEYITISSLGNAQDFGDSSQIRHSMGAVASGTRGVFGGGYAPSPTEEVNTIDYVTIASTGNAVNFGDLTAVRFGLSGCSSNTRGVFGAGCSNSPATFTNVIDFITIATLGNATDFGDSTSAHRNDASCSSPTRGIYAGGRNPSTLNTIEYITIASTGNAQDFGDLTTARDFFAGCSSNTRGLFGGGPADPGQTNIIDYITIGTLGNAQDFGDLTYTSTQSIASTSNSIRGVWAGGGNPTRLNNINYVTIATTGDAQDFGDMTLARSAAAGCSDSHGGIS